MSVLPVSPAPPVTMVIFGATGDLTRRLLVPTLINMLRSGMIDSGFRILGIGIEPGDSEMLRSRLDSFLSGTTVLSEDGGDAIWARLRPVIDYLPGDFTTDTVYRQIADYLQKTPTRNAAFYLAVPPVFFGTVVEKLAENGLMEENENVFRRVAIEKPFGTDLTSAKALNAHILEHVEESQVYRIDHFLGKETVQNIMTTRFANMMIEALWNNRYIDNVQITAAETVDVGTRGKFYEGTGALRDMVPNHLFQILAMIAMEPPNSFDAEAVRNEKAKLLSALRIYSPEEAAKNSVRGQYGEGTVDGRPVPAYTATKDVSPDSKTETFVALKLYADTWRWAGVPFYLRTGKALKARDTEIVVTFQQVPFAQFRGTEVARRLPPNKLIIQVQPDEGLHMQISIKSPGLGVDTVPVSLDFLYADRFNIGKFTGYESLLYDLFIGDQILFQRADGIEAGWAAVQPFLDLWSKSDEKPELYAPGTSGPASADALLERDKRKWNSLDKPQKKKAD